MLFFRITYETRLINSSFYIPTKRINLVLFFKAYKRTGMHAYKQIYNKFSIIHQAYLYRFKQSNLIVRQPHMDTKIPTHCVMHPVNMQFSASRQSPYSKATQTATNIGTIFYINTSNPNYNINLVGGNCQVLIYLITDEASESIP